MGGRYVSATHSATASSACLHILSRASAGPQPGGHSASRFPVHHHHHSPVPLMCVLVAVHATALDIKVLPPPPPRPAPGPKGAAASDRVSTPLPFQTRAGSWPLYSLAARGRKPRASL